TNSISTVSYTLAVLTLDEDLFLTRRNKSRTLGLKRLRKVGRSTQVVSSKDKGLGAQEDASKQGRKIDDLDVDTEVTLVYKA
ncbi:hypothetical protein Tco_0479913, partial [Tanacetum coccineum]